MLFAAILTLGALIPVAPAGGAVIDRGTVRTSDEIGPVVITDLPCLEGTEFVLTGTKVTTTRFVLTGQGLQFSEHNEGTAVPLTGGGPSYVESGNADQRSFHGSLVNGMLTFSHVNNDSFIPYLDGKRAGAAIRIHEHETFVATDTDGDGLPDEVRLDADRSRFTCP